MDLVVKSLNESTSEFSMMESGGIDRVMAKEYLPQVLKRIRGMKHDLQTFFNVLVEVEDEKYELLDDVYKHLAHVKQYITDNMQKCDSLDEKISKLI